MENPEWLVFFIFISIFISLFGCLCCCFCCCAIPVFSIFSNLFSSLTKKPDHANYQLVNLAHQNNNYYHNFNHISRRTNFNDEYSTLREPPIVEAYILPPLSSAHIINEDEENNQDAEISNSNYFNDKWAAILFIINFFVICWFASLSILDISHRPKEIFKFDLSSIGLIVITITFLFLFASLVGVGLLSILVNHSNLIIEIVLWTNILFLLFFSLSSLFFGQIFLSLVFGVIALVNYYYYLSIKPRIPFATAILETACLALKQNLFAILLTCFVSQIFQFVWVILSLLAGFNILNYFHDDQDKSEENYDSPGDNIHQDSTFFNIILTLLVFSFYWGAQVIKAIVQVTVDGAVACWYFQINLSTPVKGSLFRALTSSFGSICFGSLLVSIINTLQYILNSIKSNLEKRRNENNERNILFECLVFLLGYLLQIIETALEYFNKYAYCYIAAYGFDFIKSGRKVTKLFYEK